MLNGDTDLLKNHLIILNNSKESAYLFGNYMQALSNLRIMCYFKSKIQNIPDTNDILQLFFNQSKCYLPKMLLTQWILGYLHSKIDILMMIKAIHG